MTRQLIGFGLAIAFVAISAAEFEELVRALRAGATYANVHTTGRPAGEIRGQIKLQNNDNGNDDHGHS